MHSLFKALAATAILVVVPCMSVSAKGAQAKSTNVTTVVQSQDSAGLTNPLGGDNALNGSGDVYTTYSSKTNSLTSKIDANNDWYLDGLSSTSRKFWVTFDSPVAGSSANPLSDAFVRGTWRTLCSTNGDAQALGAMSAGQSKTCGMIFSFNFNNTNSTDYRIAFNPTRQAGSDDVLIQCLGAGANGQCNHWTIDPQSSTAIGALLRITYSRGGAMTLTPIGDYYYGFHIDVTNPANP